MGVLPTREPPFPPHPPFLSDHFSKIPIFSSQITIVKPPRKRAHLVSTVAQNCHGNFNLLTAVSICSRQFQFRSRQFQFRSRQFQFAYGSFNFAHGSFNLLTAVSISLTAVSISLMMKLQWISANIGHASCQVLWEILKYVAKLLITFVT